MPKALAELLIASALRPTQCRLRGAWYDFFNRNEPQVVPSGRVSGRSCRAWMDELDSREKGDEPMRAIPWILGILMLVILMAPAAVEAGDVGACIGLNLKGFNICTDGVDEPTCDLFCDIDGDSPDSGGSASCEFLEGETCAEQDVPWEGACDDLVIFQGAPPVCALIDSELGNTPGSELCENFGSGTWLGDGSVCGGVPALPKAGYAALALVLLAGTLTLLAFNNRS